MIKNFKLVDYPGSSGWAQCNHTCLYMKEAKVREKGEKERFGDVKLSVLRTEREVVSQGRR